MKVIKQYWKYESEHSYSSALALIEAAARTCYKSNSASDSLEEKENFIRRLIVSGHHSVLEHYNISLRIITDRGVTHELVRHRICSYSQESTRYCNYSNDRFGNEITVILPVWFYDIDIDKIRFLRSSSSNEISLLEVQYFEWFTACQVAEDSYFRLLNLGQQPQQARSVLPNSLKTEIVTTANLREWRHILKLRTDKRAHPQMRSLMLDILTNFKKDFPVFFEDIEGGNIEEVQV